MKKKNNKPDLELDRQAEEILKQFRAESPPLPAAEEITLACRTASQYLLGRRGLRRQFWRIAVSEIFFHPFIMGAVYVLLFAGCILVRLWGGGDVSLIQFLTAAAPMPFLCFLLLMFRRRNHALAEMESACLHSFQALTAARISLGLACNVLMLILAGAAASPQGDFWRLFLCGCAALLFAGGLGIGALSSAGRRQGAFAAVMSLWAVMGISLLANSDFAALLETASLPIIASLCVLGVLLNVSAIRFTSRAIRL